MRFPTVETVAPVHPVHADEIQCAIARGGAHLGIGKHANGGSAFPFKIRDDQARYTFRQRYGEGHPLGHGKLCLRIAYLPPGILDAENIRMTVSVEVSEPKVLDAKVRGWAI